MAISPSKRAKIKKGLVSGESGSDLRDKLKQIRKPSNRRGPFVPGQQGPDYTNAERGLSTSQQVRVGLIQNTLARRKRDEPQKKLYGKDFKPGTFKDYRALQYKIGQASKPGVYTKEGAPTLADLKAKQAKQAPLVAKLRALRKKTKKPTKPPTTPSGDGGYPVGGY